MFLNEVMEETMKICNSENWPIWATPENLPFFEDEIYPLFSYSYGSKVPKWKCAHNLLCKKYKNCLKLIKIADLQPPDWIQRRKNTLYHGFRFADYLETPCIIDTPIYRVFGSRVPSPAGVVARQIVGHLVKSDYPWGGSQLIMNTWHDC